jgi:hypothetical protein
VREPGRSKRTSAVPPRRTPTALSAEDQSRKALLRALREPNRIERIESTSGKLRRQFWEGAESLLDSLKSPAERDREWREAREDSEADEVAQALGRLAREQLEIDRIDEAWHWN